MLLDAFVTKATSSEETIFEVRKTFRLRGTLAGARVARLCPPVGPEVPRADLLGRGAGTSAHRAGGRRSAGGAGDGGGS